MGHDLLQSYHDELVQKLARYFKNYIDEEYPKTHPAMQEYPKLLIEVQAAFDALRDQSRNPGKPLEGQPIENK